MLACSGDTASAPGLVCVLPSRLSVRVGGNVGLCSVQVLCPVQGCVPHMQVLCPMQVLCSAPPDFLQPSQSHLPFEMEIFSHDVGFSRLPESGKPSAVSVFLLATGISQMAFNHEVRIFRRPELQRRWDVGTCVGCPEIRAVTAVTLGTDSLFFLSWELTWVSRCNQGAGVGRILPSPLPSRGSSRHQKLQRRYFYRLHCQRAPKIWLPLSCHMSLATSLSWSKPPWQPAQKLSITSTSIQSLDRPRGPPARRHDSFPSSPRSVRLPFPPQSCPWSNTCYFLDP